MSDYDSDETIGSGSDETLPPAMEDRNHSPDLFDEMTDTRKSLKACIMRKNHSRVHEISDSDSDSDDKQGKTDIKPGKMKHEKLKEPPKKESSPNSPTKFSKVSPNKSKKAKERRERQKFISEFLDMAFSDPENESIDIDKKCENNSTTDADSGKSLTKRKGSSYSDKPYKQDYSKPFTGKSEQSSGHKHANHSGKYNHSSDSSRQNYDKEKTSSLSKQSPSSLKRKHSNSPVPQELRKTVTKVLDNGKRLDSETRKPVCKYGAECYRKNPSHIEEFYHPVPKSKQSNQADDSPPPPKKQRTKAETPTTSKHVPKSRSSSPAMKVKNIEQSASPSTSRKVNEKSSWSSSPIQTLKNTTPATKCQDANSSSVRLTPSTLSTANRACDIFSQSRTFIQTPKNVTEKFHQAQPYSFFLTKVHGISDEYNSSFAMDIKDILSTEMGNLTASCQFNFMFEIPWLVKQYPQEFSQGGDAAVLITSSESSHILPTRLKKNILDQTRSKPLLIVHGEQGASKAKLQGDAMTYTNIKFCQAKLEMMYGTHHTKMMLLLYDTGMRVVIHTSNLIERDWYQKTQGMWISPVFPRLDTPGREKGDSPTLFKRDLINYIAAYKAYQLKEWIEHIEQHDMSAARVVIIGSIPGRHQGDFEKSKWGHLKVRKVLKQHGPDPSTVKTWPVIGQFSSIGSMGPNKDNWVCGEFLESLAATKASSGLQTNTRLQLIFPSKDNVRLSLEGFPAGGSIPYSVNTAKKQTYLHEFFHVWMAEGRGRSRAMPHIKTYVRPKQDGTMASWFIVTSANLSKAAWGALEKKGAQLMIRSYEIGVLFLPQFFDSGDVFKITNSIDKAKSSFKFLLPYDLPTQKYEKKDRPWMWDIPYMDLPDTNGNVWCPFSK